MSWYNTSNSEFLRFEFKEGDELSMEVLLRSAVHKLAGNHADVKTDMKTLQRRGFDGLKCSNINMDHITEVEMMEDMKLVSLECNRCGPFHKLPSTLTTLEIHGVESWLPQADFWTILEGLKHLKHLTLLDSMMEGKAYARFGKREVRAQLETILNRVDRVNLEDRLLAQLWDYPHLLKLALLKTDPACAQNTTRWFSDTRFHKRDVDMFMSLLIKDRPLSLYLNRAFDIEVLQRVCDSKDGWPDISIREFPKEDVDAVPLLKNVQRIHFWECDDGFCEWLCRSIRLDGPTLTGITTGHNALTLDQYKKIKTAMGSNTHIDESRCDFNVVATQPKRKADEDEKKDESKKKPKASDEKKKKPEADECANCGDTVGKHEGWSGPPGSMAEYCSKECRNESHPSVYA